MPLFVRILSAKGIEKDSNRAKDAMVTNEPLSALAGTWGKVNNGDSDTSKQYRVTIGFQPV